MLLCGESGAGKSTLSYACARAGWTYTSDDASYMLHDTMPPRIIGNAHQVRFRPAAKMLFPELEGYGLTPRAEGKPSIEVPIARILPGAVTSEESPVHFLIFLKREPSAYAELTPISNDEALEHLHSARYLSEEMQEVKRRQLRQLAHLPAYELRYRDLQPAIECLDKLAKSAPGVLGL
jgi:hypothetical protein